MLTKISIPNLKKPLVWIITIVMMIALLIAWQFLHSDGPGPNFVSGNGRLEATTIDVATKVAGRIEQVYVKDGDYVSPGQPLVQMQMSVLQAQRDEAQARQLQASHAVATAQAQVAVRLSDVAATQAIVVMRESELQAAQKRVTRTSILASEGAASRQELDDDRARVQGAQAAAHAARAQVQAARAGVTAAQTQVVGAQAEVSAIFAALNRVDAEIFDSLLTSPRAARVQFIIAHPGEVVGPGGKILNLIDLQDVYMTFFLPESAAGKAGIGDEVRIVLDAEPEKPIPATIVFVSSTAQFTPKTVETASERQKLMFRVKAQIEQAVIDKNINVIKSGIPGLAWFRLDPHIAWPKNLELRNEL